MYDRHLRVSKRSTNSLKCNTSPCRPVKIRRLARVRIMMGTAVFGPSVPQADAEDEARIVYDS